VAASRTACFNLLYFHMHTQGLSAMLKAPLLQWAEELVKRETHTFYDHGCKMFMWLWLSLTENVGQKMLHY